MTPAVRAALVIINAPLVFIAASAARYYAVNGHTDHLISSGERRGYVLYVPRSYDASRPTPLVISLHGAALWGAAQRDVSGWNDVADREGFLVAYPSGAGRAAPRVWRSVESDTSVIARDTRFVADLIDSIGVRYNLDRSRVYANGFSNGGGMTFALSCALPHRIAAVGMVGAAQTMPWGLCHDSTPVPAIVFHGTADPAMPYDGGMSWVGPRAFPSVNEWVGRWARRNRCDASFAESRVAADVVRRTYAGCADGAAVVLYTIEGGGHVWPGGGDLPGWLAGRPITSIHASSVMWAFFSRHALPASLR